MIHRNRHFSVPYLLRLVICIFSFSIFKVSLQAAQIEQYLVQLKEDPVATYITKLSANSLSSNAASFNESAYRQKLLAQQATLIKQVEALPQAKVLAQMETVFNGLAISISSDALDSIRQLPGVDKIYPDIRYHKALEAALPLIHVPEAWTAPQIGGEANAGAGIKIGIIDTGIDINHPMLQDASLVPPSGFPQFTVPSSSCANSDQRFTNSKVIVARNYIRLVSSTDPNCDAQDRDGHGTFVASIAAGRRATSPFGSLVGVAPKAFLGSYKVFGTPGSTEGTNESAIIKALDDAVNDGMQVINLSLGAPADRAPDNDPLAVAVAVAVDLGVIVVVAAGNDGPGSGTVDTPGIAQSAITVGSSTNSRTIANPLSITSAVTVPENLRTIGSLPGNGPDILANVGPAPLHSVSALDGSGYACSPLPPGSLEGRMALILRGCCKFSTKIQNAIQAGALAAIVYNNQIDGSPVLMSVGDATQIPSAMIGGNEGFALEQFLSSQSAGASAVLSASRIGIHASSNRAASFSGNGPSTSFGIKPDLLAPGTNIYAATQANFQDGEQFNSSGFITGQGTSFSAPFVSGAAAIFKQSYPNLNPRQIKSALVNTASRVVRDADGSLASVQRQGLGLLNLEAALNTPIVVSPVSLSFSANTPGSTLNFSTNIQVTKIDPETDTFTVTSVQTLGNVPLSLIATPSVFSLANGASATISFSARSTVPLSETFEGFLTIQGQTSQRSVAIPFWGTFQRPQVNISGVVNAAGFSFSSARIAPGSLVSIFGTGLSGPSQPTVTVGGFDAPILFASSLQINAQVPFEIAGFSSAPVVVKVNGVSSAPVNISLSSSAPGVFTLNQSGQGHGAILHNSNFNMVTSANPVQRGEVIALFATGLGDVFPTVETGSPAASDPLSTSLPANIPNVTIGGIPATVQFSGMAPCFIGLYQINIVVPANAPIGEPDLVLTSSGQSSNPIKLPVGSGPVAQQRDHQQNVASSLLQNSSCNDPNRLTSSSGTG